MTIEIGTPGTARGIKNECIVIATDGPYLWVKDRSGATRTTVHETEFAPTPPVPRVMYDSSNDAFIQLTPEVRAVLKTGGIAYE